MRGKGLEYFGSAAYSNGHKIQQDLMYPSSTGPNGQLHTNG